MISAVSFLTFVFNSTPFDDNVSFKETSRRRELVPQREPRRPSQVCVDEIVCLEGVERSPTSHQDNAGPTTEATPLCSPLREIQSPSNLLAGSSTNLQARKLNYISIKIGSTLTFSIPNCFSAAERAIMRVCGFFRRNVRFGDARNLCRCHAYSG